MQITIMSKSTAERCGLLRLADTHVQGEVHGAGTAKMFGEPACGAWPTALPQPTPQAFGHGVNLLACLLTW